VQRLQGVNMAHRSTYSPVDDIGAGRPSCRHCGAAYRLHGAAGLPGDSRAKLADAGKLPCPVAYRPDTLAAAQRALERAVASGDLSGEFVARGDVQRLRGTRL
jgi:hypothetical protein